MKKIFIVLSLTLGYFYGNSQTKNIPTFSYTGNEFSPSVDKFIAKQNQLYLYITNYLSSNYSSLHTTLCNNGVTLLKFRIDRNGKLVEISVSKTTPPLLSQALKEALTKSEKYWKSSKKKGTKLLIQPIFYDYHSQCDLIKYDFYSLQGGIFEFDDNTKISNLDCVFFDPLLTSSGIEESDLTNKRN
ncbi:MAG: hypothetical protein O9294_18430 [Cytophagales bacterium]|jgi:hypothetical protein|nr:hypothetical protein [Cytophagales bacterium]